MGRINSNWEHVGFTRMVDEAADIAMSAGINTHTSNDFFLHEEKEVTSIHTHVII